MLTVFVLALTALTAMPATTQTPPTVDITATNNNGDRDSNWPGLQVDEGDAVTVNITPSTTVTSGLVTYDITSSGNLLPGDLIVRRTNNPLTIFPSFFTTSTPFVSGQPNADGSGSNTILVINNDGVSEPDETLTLTISNIQNLLGATQGFVLGTDSVTITVRGTDSAPAFGTVSTQTFYKGVYTKFQLPVSGGNGPLSCTATNLPAGLTLDTDGSGSCPGPETCAICGRLSSTQTVTLTARDADSNTASNDQATLSFTINTARHPADITDSNGLDETDALLLFQHSSGVQLTDNHQAQRVDTWQRDTGQALGGDINEDRSIDGQDALIMYYAYQFGDVLDNHPDLRRLFLNGVRGRRPPTDATYRELLRRANRLRGL